MPAPPYLWATEALFLSTCQRKYCKELSRQLPRLPQWIRTYTEQTIFLNQRSAVNDVNFQQTLQ